MFLLATKTKQIKDNIFAISNKEIDKVMQGDQQETKQISTLFTHMINDIFIDDGNIEEIIDRFNSHFD